MPSNFLYFFLSLFSFIFNENFHIKEIWLNSLSIKVLIHIIYFAWHCQAGENTQKSRLCINVLRKSNNETFGCIQINASCEINSY